MWKQLILGFGCITLVIVQVSFGKLHGDHVCQEEESYKVNVTEYFTRNATVRNYQWCMNVPPRCSFYTSRLINDSRIVEKVLTRPVEKCCQGFVEVNNECILECPKCVHGLCQGRKCVCHAGYHGPHCDTTCSNNKWGINCINDCNCERGDCNSKNGSCNCPPGWIGQRCQQKCTEGFFGQDCQHVCNCPGVCDFVTGDCPKLETTTLDPTTTSSTTSTTNTITEKTTENLSTLGLGTTTNAINYTSSTTMENSVLYNVKSSKETIDSTEPTTIVPAKSNGKFKSSDEFVELTTLNTLNEAIKISTTTVINTVKERKKFSSISTTASTNEAIIMQSFNNSEEDERNLTKNLLNDHNYLIKGRKNNVINDMNKENGPGSDQSNNNDHYGEKTSSSSFNSLLPALVIMVILLLILAFIANKIRKSKSKCKLENGTASCSMNGKNNVRKNGTNISSSTTAGVSTIHRQSIFHSPLPDPPTSTFDNPTYLSPPEPICIINNNGQDNNHFSGTTTFEVKSLSELQYSNGATYANGSIRQKRNMSKNEIREYVYDHPPPSNKSLTLRRISSPEVEITETEMNSESEPLYDEIRQQQQQQQQQEQQNAVASNAPNQIYENSSNTHINNNNNQNNHCLYMNTCAKTRF